MKKKIGIIDVGYGNIFSIRSAINELNHKPILSRKYKELLNCDKLILPGVGALAMSKIISKEKLDNSIKELVMVKKKHILGICLGFQLLGKSSCEMGEHEGLGLVDFKIESFENKKNKYFIPHIGWNSVNFKNNPLFKNIPNKSLFYFVHSYCLKNTNKKFVYGKTSYIHNFVSVIIKDNIFATQFHPEKSQKNGLQLIQNFINL